jgi:hypothetical protein
LICFLLIYNMSADLKPKTYVKGKMQFQRLENGWKLSQEQECSIRSSYFRSSALECACKFYIITLGVAKMGYVTESTIPSFLNWTIFCATDHFTERETCSGQGLVIVSSVLI